MKKIITNTLSICLAFTILLNSGCASIFGRSHYSVAIKSNPPSALITITNRKGVEVYKGTAPAVVDLKSSAGYMSREIYQVKFHIEGYQDKTITVEGKLNGWYIGNLIFGGALGMLIIDPLTGAMYKVTDTNVSADLQQSAHAQVAKLEIMDIKDVPDSLKGHLVAVK